MGTQLGDQLTKALKEKRIEVRFPKGYRKWRKKFYEALRESRGDVHQALDKVHGRPKNST